MSSLGTITYNLSAKDTSTPSGGKGLGSLRLRSDVAVTINSLVCDIKELTVRGVNQSDSVKGNADIKLSGTYTGCSCAAHNSDWLRAVARMFNRLADNMDQLPTHTQTIAQMVANKLD